MKEDKICPYPGLRPFNEEESIFFRGREEHVEKIISDLQDKNFLMLTGASGDGKSSMVYAGIIPNARAGFFKAKFNSWVIADFRPERSPLKNLATVLSEKLGYNNVELVQKELGYGFSSLIDLYKKSPYYLDLNSENFKSLTDIEQKKLKRKASNLFILVDQFEEFFTNSENYNNGKASVNAQVTVNLLLETARIALAEKLPIYIVCTMRSDYIGECAVFRGLPEYIGFSQFFVPRLKRKEVYQVIEEPAVLSGNKISNRLIETLINECDGLDQLPILQHALNRIWRAHVEDGAEEMDLIHYAKVGGLAQQLLPQNQKDDFVLWYNKQPEFKQRIVSDNPSLANVLNAHARELYESAVDYCSKHIGREITKKVAQETLKQIFTCLTKINDSKAVRNRATVLEVKQIIGNGIDNKLIEGLINLYREPANTLLKPFITDQHVSHNLFAQDNGYSLADTDMLDITHESLIRNWTDLILWTKEDNEHVSVIEDLKIQVDRWQQQKRSSDYLLTIGSLSYFKTWYNSVNLNPYWLAKYDNSNRSPEQKLLLAKTFIEPAKDFIRISEAHIKRNRRILVAVATSIAIVLIGFTSWAFVERKKALEKTELATRAENQAKIAADQANEAKDEALESKEIAFTHEREALQAAQQAKKSKQDALIAKSRAEVAFQQAHKNAELAKSETEKANQALVESEKAKQEAIQSKIKAEKAEKDASRIGLLSLAQSVALKSELYVSDPQLEGLLAYQAYMFTLENNGNVEDAILYEAIRAAYFNLNKEALVPKMTTTFEQRAAVLLEDNVTMLTADKSGGVYSWDIINQKIKDSGDISVPDQIETVSIVQKLNILICGLKNGNVLLWDIKKVSSPIFIKELNQHKGALRAIDVDFDKQLFATSGKDSSVCVWKNISAKAELLKQIKFNSAIRDQVILPDGNKLLVALENGNLAVAEITTEKINMIYRDKGSKPWCIGINEQKTTVAVGFSDGKIRLFDPEKILTAENLIHTFSENNTVIENITFNNKGDLLAVASADKLIKIYNVSKTNQKAFEVKDIKSKTRFLLFDKNNMLYSLGSDHAIRVIEPSVTKLVAPFCDLLKRNLTHVEWRQNISETMPYRKTCINKP
jgi:hypothetical protein